jgi:hypothetical protein
LTQKAHSELRSPHLPALPNCILIVDHWHLEATQEEEVAKRQVRTMDGVLHDRQSRPRPGQCSALSIVEVQDYFSLSVFAFSSMGELGHYPGDVLLKGSAFTFCPAGKMSTNPILLPQRDRPSLLHRSSVTTASFPRPLPLRMPTESGTRDRMMVRFRRLFADSRPGWLVPLQ